MEYKERKQILTRKINRVQSKIKAFLMDGDSRSRAFWLKKEKLNRLQWKLYKLTCKPNVILKTRK